MSDQWNALVEAGLVVLDGNQYVLTPRGQRALRHGIPSKPFGKTLAVDAVRSRLKPSIKKKGKRP